MLRLFFSLGLVRVCFLIGLRTIYNNSNVGPKLNVYFWCRILCLVIGMCVSLNLLIFSGKYYKKLVSYILYSTKAAFVKIVGDKAFNSCISKDT